MDSYVICRAVLLNRPVHLEMEGLPLPSRRQNILPGTGDGVPDEELPLEFDCGLRLDAADLAVVPRLEGERITGSGVNRHL